MRVIVKSMAFSLKNPRVIQLFPETHQETLMQSITSIHLFYLFVYGKKFPETTLKLESHSTIYGVSPVPGVSPWKTSMPRMLLLLSSRQHILRVNDERFVQHIEPTFVTTKYFSAVRCWYRCRCVWNFRRIEIGSVFNYLYTNYYK